MSLMPPNLPAPKAVLFDWDGTLANTIPVIQTSINHILRQFNHPPAPFGTAHLASVTGSTGLFNLLLGEEQGKHAKDMYESYLDGLYAANGGPITTDLARPGATEILQYLKSAKICTGIATNKLRGRFQMECDAMGFGPYLSTIVTLDQVTNRKPHPEMIELALSRLNVIAGPDVWMVGDHKVDSESAKQAGITAIHLDDGFALSETHPPDMVVDGLTDLLEVIRELHSAR